jgi:parallel beta-helix repeat protein
MGIFLRTKALVLILAFSLVFGVSVVFPLSFGRFYPRQNYAAQQDNLRVHNLNTGEKFSSIQEAINAPGTLDGHQISVASGVYHEHLTVDKSLSLIGEARSTTIIDGSGSGKVVYVTADNVEIRNFTIQNGSFGLWVDDSPNSRIIGNTFQDGSYGLRLYDSRNSEVVGNNVYRYTWFGIEIKSSGNSTLRENAMMDNEYNLGVDGNVLSDFINDIDVSNTVNDKPVHYWINKHDITIDSSSFQEIGYLGLVNSTNIDVKDLNVQDNKEGLLFAFARNSTISNVNARDNWNGIYVAHSVNVSVTGNSANSNFDYGIKFFNSSHSVARGNNVDNNGWAGIGVVRSPNSRVEGNEANFNTYDLHIVYTNNSVIAGNSALIQPGARTCYSIAVYYSHSNVIYHNAFDNRLLYVEPRNWTGFTPPNSWDDGVEGNYWSGYRGGDADLDGIGDTPYVVGDNNVDNYPLMGKFSEYGVILKGETYSVSVISNSTLAQFEFGVDEGRISLLATGENGTIGFLRIAVPKAFLGALEGGNLSILINGEPPVLERKWTDGVYTYFYFSYVNGVSEPTIIPWLIAAAAVASVFLLVCLLVFWSLRRRRAYAILTTED